MRFAYDFTSPVVLLAAAACLAMLVGFGVMLVLASFARSRAQARFGEPGLVAGLQSFDATARRGGKGALLVLAMACAFAALARPQFGRGTRLVPATNLDVVVVLDYSKSMYARDVAPSRIVRAKAEVAKLIQGLPGARFGAVAFAGEPISFPLTSDGAAIAQFFRQMEPNDMPVGGTATARALERARELLARDPKSKEHVRVIVLVTDGEDLEGNPEEVAQAAAQEQTRVDVVQIGGRAPEILPEIGPDGTVIGVRRDEAGRPISTELSAEGEAQLARIAQATGGTIVRAEKGATGIDVVAKGLARMMREELSERVETVYAEEYGWPLGACVVLLLVEAFLAEAPGRRRRTSKQRNVATLAVLILALGVAGCQWDPSRPFERESPVVNRALRALDGGDAPAAAAALTEYLSTGPCSEGNIGTPDLVRNRREGAFDLGLALFRVGEAFGRPFGEEEQDGGVAEPVKAQRRAEVDCALRIVQVVANHAEASPSLRARARYLEGNLNFLDSQYEEAVKAYDQALAFEPGQVDAGDPVGRDAAWNRAVALRRIEDKKNQNDGGADGGPDGGHPDGGPPDASPPDASSPDGGSPDAGEPPRPDGGGPDGGPPDSGKPDEGNDGGSDGGAPPEDDGGAPPPPPPRANQDERMLDQLENAPTVQKEAAKKQATKRRVRGMADK